jgi:hypothetical protein
MEISGDSPQYSTQKEGKEEVPEEVRTQRSYRDAVQENFRDSKFFPEYVEDATDRYQMTIVVNTTREILNREATKLKVAPFSITRIKGRANTWNMSFSPKYVEELHQLKNSGANIAIGDLKVLNLHYSPSGRKVDQVKITYSLDMQECITTTTKEMEEKLKEKGVGVVFVARDQLHGIETGIVTVCATTKHEDKAIVLEFGKEMVTLERVDAKTQRRRAAKKDLESKNKEDHAINPKSKEKKFFNKGRGWEKAPKQWKRVQKKDNNLASVPLQNSFTPLADDLVNSISATDDQILQNPMDPTPDSTPTKDQDNKSELVKEATDTTPKSDTEDSAKPDQHITVTVRENAYGMVKEIIDSKSGLITLIHSPKLNSKTESKLTNSTGSTESIERPLAGQTDGEILKGKKQTAETEEIKEGTPLKSRLRSTSKRATTQNGSGLGSN